MNRFAHTLVTWCCLVCVCLSTFSNIACSSTSVRQGQTEPALAAFAAPGDQPSRPRPGEQVAVELLESDQVLVNAAEAHINGDRLEVTGTVSRTRTYCCGPARGHVDIAVFGPADDLLEMVSTYYSPRNVSTRTGGTSRFAVALSVPELPTGSTVRLVYHDVYHGLPDADRSGAFQCDMNQAYALAQAQ